ncbi:MAG: GDP-mannose 4,6-dehydratase, partial [Bacillota bacterium]
NDVLVDLETNTVDNQLFINEGISTSDIVNINYDLIKYVKDRLGHDRRYAIDYTKIKRKLGWKPKINFNRGIRKTVKWYLKNQDWINNVIKGRGKIV